MSENHNDKSAGGDTSAVDKQGAEASEKTSAVKAAFGSLTPLTTAQIITLLVGTTSSNSSYGGY